MIKYLLSIADLSHDHIIANNDQSVVIKKPEWSVTISKEHTYHASPIIYFPQLFLSFTGDEEILDDVIRQLRTKTFRVGG